MAPYSYRESKGAWEKASSEPYERAALNERAAKKAGEKENGKRERMRERERRGSL